MTNSLRNLLKNRTLLKTTCILSLPVILLACDGPSNIANPFQGGDEIVNSGPPAATADVRSFEVNVWNNLKAENRCGQCHFQGDGGQAPEFAETSDVNVAYSFAVPLVNLQDPSSSLLVTKLEAGHHCWEQFDSVCADSVESMITNWAGVSDDITTARAIKLTPPPIKNPGDSKTYPETAIQNSPNSFAETIHPILLDNCINCHFEEGSIQQQAPFFANPDVNSSYEAVKPKINVDFPINSRLVSRLLDGHNCWTDCGSYNPDTGEATGDAGEMLDAIKVFANAIEPDEIDPLLVTSKALVLLGDGIIASGGNRHEANQIAIWEFKVGTGSTAFDTSGIEPAINLTLDGDYSWLDAYGINLTDGRAWADTHSSKKLHDFIKSSGEYSLETWVLPANVTQEDANIMSLDAGPTSKNFAISQFMYNYNFHNRTALSDTDGRPVLSTEDAGEILQSSLQHVVATYDPIEGRKIYVNGELIVGTEAIPDPISDATSINSWDDTFAFVLGNSSGGSSPWAGQIRMAAVHNRQLTPTQIKQNYDVGVGQKYFLLFSISDQLDDPSCLQEPENAADPMIHNCFIRMEVSQYDSFSYLFLNPTFINLDANWVPGGFNIQKMRLGINGKLAVAGQAFGYMNETIDDRYTSSEGQLLSPHGAVIALEKGADSDEFFLTFEVLADNTNTFTDPDPVAPAEPADADPVSQIGVRTFDEINATIAKMTGIPITNSAVDTLFRQYKQQLPPVESIDAFLSSHQMAIAQLALTSCSERVEADRALPVGSPARVLFTDVNFDDTSGSAFDTEEERANVINPVLNAVLLNDLDSQPDHNDIRDLLGATSVQHLTNEDGEPLEDPDNEFTDDSYQSLITKMNTVNTSARTVEIVKAVCAAAVGSAAMLIQ